LGTGSRACVDEATTCEELARRTEADTIEEEEEKEARLIAGFLRSIKHRSLFR
jgi:hypothetical protein